MNLLSIYILYLIFHVNIEIISIYHVNSEIISKIITQKIIYICVENKFNFNFKINYYK